jgi:hypothetical protein
MPPPDDLLPREFLELLGISMDRRDASGKGILGTPGRLGRRSGSYVQTLLLNASTINYKIDDNRAVRTAGTVLRVADSERTRKPVAVANRR